jgi:carboxypeptidase C (cathepsin A)
MKRYLLALILPLIVLCPAAAEETEPAPDARAEPTPMTSVTEHEIRIEGKAIEYTATAGWMIMENDADEAIARFGYTAYALVGVEDKATRPILFAYNGGPGSSSIWLHMGVLGPRRVDAVDAAHSPPAPIRLVDNGESVLDVTDIVMIDPVGTGFSKALGEAKPEEFWGVDQDLRSVGDFVKRYVSEHGRWASPKYLLGESYGGMRTAGLVNRLQTVAGMHFNGVILVSPFLDMGSGLDGAEIDLPHVLYLPTLAATAWYHEILDDRPEDLESFLAEVERFAYDEYAPALLKGYTIGKDEKQAVAGKLAGFTGTSVDWWMRADLRVTHVQFLQELQRNERVVTGRIDTRFVGPSINPLAESMDYDPFFPAVGPVFTGAFLHYLHDELEFGRDENYVVTAFDIRWDWEHAQPGAGAWALPFANTVPDLANALTMNPGLHVLVQQGWFDLATPHFAMKHDLSKLDITDETRERIRVEYYDAGHMMYLHQPSRVKFRADLVRFIEDSARL